MDFMLHLFPSYTQTHYKYIKFPQRVIFQHLSIMFSPSSQDFHGIISTHTVSLGIMPYHSDL